MTSYLFPPQIPAEGPEGTAPPGEKRAFPSTLEETKALLRRLGLRAEKGLGQHFLVDRGILRRILAAAGLTPTDTVVEVGPGLGLLTRELVQRAERVIAVELDARLAEALSRELASCPNFTLVPGDILELAPEKLGARDGRYKVVANLPYYIATAVLRRFLEAEARPSLMVVMVQKEVGQNILACPGRMGLLSVSVQVYARPSLVGYVPARSFYPAPKVSSAILRLEVYPQPVIEAKDREAFFRVVRAGFSAPRKQLHNALAQGLGCPPGEVEGMLQRAGIEPKRRAQTLSVEEWLHLYRFWESGRGQGEDP